MSQYSALVICEWDGCTMMYHSARNNEGCCLAHHVLRATRRGPFKALHKPLQTRCMHVWNIHWAPMLCLVRFSNVTITYHKPLYSTSYITLYTYVDVYSTYETRPPSSSPESKLQLMISGHPAASSCQTTKALVSFPMVTSVIWSWQQSDSQPSQLYGFLGVAWGSWFWDIPMIWSCWTSSVHNHT